MGGWTGYGWKGAVFVLAVGGLIWYFHKSNMSFVAAQMKKKKKKKMAMAMVDADAMAMDDAMAMQQAMGFKMAMM